MSLFDVIRYPITDIYDSAQLECIPRPIISDWEDYISRLYSIVEVKSITESMPILMSLGVCIYDIALELTLKKDSTETLTECKNRIEDNILNHLKKLIKDYNNEPL